MSARARLAYRMKLQGHTYREIGLVLGVSPSRANQLFFAGELDIERRATAQKATCEHLGTAITALQRCESLRRWLDT